MHPASVLTLPLSCHLAGETLQSEAPLSDEPNTANCDLFRRHTPAHDTHTRSPFRCATHSPTTSPPCFFSFSNLFSLCSALFCRCLTYPQSCDRTIMLCLFPMTCLSFSGHLSEDRHTVHVCSQLKTAARDTMAGPGAWSSRARRLTHLRPVSHWSSRLRLKASLVDLLLFSRVNITRRHHQRSSCRARAQPTQNTTACSPTQGPRIWSSHTRCVTHLIRASRWSPSSLRAFVGCTRLEPPLVSEFTTFVTSLVDITHMLLWGSVRLCLDIIQNIVFIIRIFYFLLISNWLIL